MISKKLDPTNRPAVDGPSLVLNAIMPAAAEIQTASMSRDVASAGLRTCCVHARWTRTVNCVHQLVGYLAKRASRGAKRPARPEGRGARGGAARSGAVGAVGIAETGRGLAGDRPSAAASASAAALSMAASRVPSAPSAGGGGGRAAHLSAAASTSSVLVMDRAAHPGGLEKPTETRSMIQSETAPSRRGECR